MYWLEPKANQTRWTRALSRVWSGVALAPHYAIRGTTIVVVFIAAYVAGSVMEGWNDVRYWVDRN